MSAENSNLKGIASDLKNPPLPVSQQPDQVAQPSAPPMSADQDLCNSIAAAAAQPPPHYYEQGLFGANTHPAVQPQHRASNTDSLHNQTIPLLH